jgi:hypothetical protein
VRVVARSHRTRRHERFKCEAPYATRAAPAGAAQPLSSGRLGNLLAPSCRGTAPLRRPRPPRQELD